MRMARGADIPEYAPGGVKIPISLTQPPSPEKLYNDPESPNVMEDELKSRLIPAIKTNS